MLEFWIRPLNPREVVIWQIRGNMSLNNIWRATAVRRSTHSKTGRRMTTSKDPPFSDPINLRPVLLGTMVFSVSLIGEIECMQYFGRKCVIPRSISAARMQLGYPLISEYPQGWNARQATPFGSSGSSQPVTCTRAPQVLHCHDGSSPPMQQPPSTNRPSSIWRPSSSSITGDP